MSSSKKESKDDDLQVVITGELDHTTQTSKTSGRFQVYMKRETFDDLNVESLPEGRRSEWLKSIYKVLILSTVGSLLATAIWRVATLWPFL